MGGGSFRLPILFVVNWLCLEQVEQVIIFIRCSMLERRYFDDVVSEALEVSRRTWDGA